MSREPLTLAVGQPVIRAHDLVANVEAHADAVRASDSRVVVFPEMSLTGYELDAAPVAPDDAVLAPLVAACAATGALALVGAPVRDADGRDRVGVLAVDGRGATIVYRKVWVDPSEARFAPGPGPVVVEVDGWRLGLGVCRDTRFADHAAATAALGMDVYAAGVLHHAHEDAVAEERARRVIADHGVWVATASFAGPTGGGFDATAGGSAVWAPTGTVVARAPAEPGAVACAVLAD